MFQVPTQYICQGCAFDIGFRQCIEWGTISTRIGRSCLLRGTYLESHKNFIAKSGPNRPVQPKMAAFTSSLFFFHCTANPNALKCEASAVKTSLGFPVGPSLPTNFQAMPHTRTRRSGWNLTLQASLYGFFIFRDVGSYTRVRGGGSRQAEGPIVVKMRWKEKKRTRSFDGLVFPASKGL